MIFRINSFEAVFMAGLIFLEIGLPIIMELCVNGYRIIRKVEISIMINNNQKINRRSN